MSDLLDDRTHRRPVGSLHVPHPESQTHLLKVRTPKRRLVPVPTGPGIPRRDRAELKERYCRLMLIFFKPWRRPSDLRDPGQTWSDAFTVFESMCHPRFKSMMKNMQILHECRDSRDDHFHQRR
ncbi:hypothetical protein BV22DRAFT_1012930, partial [Leucogyrophana mollusca]